MDGVTNSGGRFPSVSSPIGQVVKEDRGSVGAIRSGEVATPEEVTRADDVLVELSKEERLKIGEVVVRSVGEIYGSRTALRFSMADANGGPIIRVVDAKTEEVIREIPPEELMAVAQALREFSGESGSFGHSPTIEGVVNSFLVDIVA